MLFSRTAPYSYCLAAVLVMAPGVTANDEKIDPRSPYIGSHVRGANPGINKLIARGVKASPTFAGLVAALDQSDVIVYIEVTNKLPMSIDGRIAFMASTGPLRYLHAQVRDGLGFESTIATAGHELQHALEIAAHPEVRDSASLAQLYRRIGDPSVPHAHQFDTPAARHTGRRVRQELG